MRHDDRQHAAQWARQLLTKGEFVILDSETTGLSGTAEIVQIAILDPTGRVLLDTLVRPTRPIPRDASAIHGITDAMVQDAPTFAAVAPVLRTILSGTTCVIYNADYDTRLMEQSSLACGIAIEIPAFAGEYQCAMEMYAAWVGEYSHYHGDYKYQRLPGGDHSAVGDALACLKVMRRMAGTED
jgi:DNA polymerase-3 subunit epsilon